MDKHVLQHPTEDHDDTSYVMYFLYVKTDNDIAHYTSLLLFIIVINLINTLNLIP